MRSIIAFWKNSIFGKIVGTFLLIILPIYGLGIGIYNDSLQTQRTDMSKNMLSQVGFYISDLESQIQRIRGLQYACAEDINLQQLSNIPYALNEFEKLQAIQRLQQRLTAIANSSIYIKNVKAYIPSMDSDNKDDTYGLALLKDSPGFAGAFGNIVGFFNSYHAYPNAYIKDPAGKLTYGSILPEMKTALAKLAQMYKDGLLDKGSQVKTRSHFRKSI